MNYGTQPLTVPLLAISTPVFQFSIHHSAWPPYNCAFFIYVYNRRSDLLISSINDFNPSELSHSLHHLVRSSLSKSLFIKSLQLIIQYPVLFIYTGISIMPELILANIGLGRIKFLGSHRDGLGIREQIPWVNLLLQPLELLK
jgi:hypothetical protein